MKNEKIVKRKDGTKYRIEVFSDHYATRLDYTFSVSVCLPRKRTWQPAIDVPPYDCSKDTPLQHQKNIRDQYLKLITEDELQETLDELAAMYRFDARKANPRTF